MNTRLIDAAHDSDYDCAYNFGRECDCSAASDTVARIMPELFAVIDEALNQLEADARQSLPPDLATAPLLTTTAKARTYIRRALA